jgi:hypothetical protein
MTKRAFPSCPSIVKEVVEDKKKTCEREEKKKRLHGFRELCCLDDFM